MLNILEVSIVIFSYCECFSRSDLSQRFKLKFRYLLVFDRLDDGRTCPVMC